MAKPSGFPKTQPAKLLSEDDMIALWLAPLAGPAGLGLRDDAALITVPAGFQLVTTVDALVAGVHFLPMIRQPPLPAKCWGSIFPIWQPKAARRSAFCSA